MPLQLLTKFLLFLHAMGGNSTGQVYAPLNRRPIIRIAAEVKETAQRSAPRNPMSGR